MSDLPIYDMWRGALGTIVMVGAPFILAALAVGLTMAIVQAATQLQENVLTFVPKVLAIAAALILIGPWALDQLTRYTERSAETIEQIGRTGPR